MEAVELVLRGGFFAERGVLKQRVLIRPHSAKFVGRSSVPGLSNRLPKSLCYADILRRTSRTPRALEPPNSDVEEYQAIRC